MTLALQCIYERNDDGGENRMKRRGVRFLEDGREWRLPELLYKEDLVLCEESEEDLRAIVGRFIEVRCVEDV